MSKRPSPPKEERIYKYEIGIMDKQSIQMPQGAQILTAQVQRGQLYIWALVNILAPTETRTIAVYGTGNALPKHLGDYIGTVQMPPFVWHIFDLG
jgi:hypothetical protein